MVAGGIGLVTWCLSNLWWALHLKILSKSKTRVSDVVPNKPECDKLNYRVIRLRNDLRILLVRDVSNNKKSWRAKSEVTEPEERQAAVGLAVAVGSFWDPPEAQGLAHFLEHMVFMGSQKYPAENALEDFLNMHGGFSNAHTEAEKTAFYFDVKPDHLAAALDIFVNFFVEPLLRADCISRELQAVDNEFQLAMHEDELRLQQIILSLSKKESVLNKFMWGNDKSLRKLPQKAGIDIRNLLSKFYNEHYKPENMCAVIRGPHSIDELQNMAEKTFGEIRRGNGPVRNSGQVHPTTWERPWTEYAFHRLIYVTPVKDNHEIVMMWNFESLQDTWKIKPMMFLSEILGFEGRGSLYSYFHKRRWCTELSVGNKGEDIDASSRHCTLMISVTLTMEGVRHTKEIVMSVLHYLHMLRNDGPSRKLYEEFQQISENYFRFRQDVEPLEFVENVVSEMMYYPDTHILDGDCVMMEYDADTIQRLLGRLRFSSMLVGIISCTVADHCTETEQWFGTKYGLESFPEDWIEEAFAIETSQGCPIHFHLPDQNPFVATDFTKFDDPHPNKEPTIVHSEHDMECWYLHDSIFSVPRTCIRVQLHNTVLHATPKGSITGLLIIEMAQILLKEKLYPAEIADLSYAIETEELGMFLAVTGYSSKVNLVFDILCSTIFNFDFDSDLLSMAKEVWRRRLVNAELDPSNLARDIRLFCLALNSHSMETLFSELIKITIEDVRHIYDELMENHKAVIYVHGNASLDHFHDIIRIFKKHRRSTKYEKFMHQPILHLAPGVLFHCATNKNSEDINNAIEMYFQVPGSCLHTRAVHRLLCAILEEPFFQSLRTEQQLGYHVSMSRKNTFGKLGFGVEIASAADRFSTTKMVECVESFLQNFKNKLQSMPNDTFSKEPEVHELMAVTKDEVISMYKQYLHPSSHERCALLIAVQSTSDKRWLIILCTSVAL
eukprot:gene1420-4584_t